MLRVLLLRFDFMKSKLLFESLSNGSRAINLVSHSLLAYDTRSAEPASRRAAGPRSNVFSCILQPSKTGSNRASLQLELHYRYSYRWSYRWSCTTGTATGRASFLLQSRGVSP